MWCIFIKKDSTLDKYIKENGINKIPLDEKFWKKHLKQGNYLYDRKYSKHPGFYESDIVSKFFY